MQKFYVVKEIGGGFDGLIIEGKNEAGSNLVEVFKLIDRDSIAGDRNVSLPIEQGVLFISLSKLQEIDDPGTREFAANNPFGKLVLEGHMELGSVKVSYAQFESVMSVNIMDVMAKKTVFSQYFSKDFEKIRQTIEDVLKEGDGTDADDLVFRLQELKELEKNG